MSTILHAALGLDALGAAGYAIRRLATAEEATVVVTHRTYGQLRRHCGSD